MHACVSARMYECIKSVSTYTRALIRMCTLGRFVKSIQSKLFLVIKQTYSICLVTLYVYS